MHIYLQKIGGDTAENEQIFLENIDKQLADFSSQFGKFFFKRFVARARHILDYLNFCFHARRDLVELFAELLRIAC